MYVFICINVNVCIYERRGMLCHWHCTNSFLLNINLTLVNVWSGNMLSFTVDGKQAFEVSLADVSQSQLQGKNDVLLEFHVDDTTGANEVCLYAEKLCLVGFNVYE